MTSSTGMVKLNGVGDDSAELNHTRHNLLQLGIGSTVFKLVADAVLQPEETVESENNQTDDA